MNVEYDIRIGAAGLIEQRGRTHAADAMDGRGHRNAHGEQRRSANAGRHGIGCVEISNNSSVVDMVDDQGRCCFRQSERHVPHERLAR